MPTAKLPNYAYSGSFDQAVFQTEFNTAFAKNPRYNAAAVPDLLVLLGLIERDPGINDVRQAAYILATVMWETTSPTTITRPLLDKKGLPLLDKKKQPKFVKQKKWQMTMAPVSEVGLGKGRRYHEPVKVQSQLDGSVRITEQDGDQFLVSEKGSITRLTKKAVMGTADGGAAVKAYIDDEGFEEAYYGRGYVQLTWWSNYASAGVAIGKGLDLLLYPELVQEPETAYSVMSHGMRTGKGFANGHRFAKYFTTTQTDYVSARRMVNGSDHAADIAAIAKKFETVLLKARRVVPAALPAR